MVALQVPPYDAAARGGVRVMSRAIPKVSDDGPPRDGKRTFRAKRRTLARKNQRALKYEGRRA